MKYLQDILINGTGGLQGRLVRKQVNNVDEGGSMTVLCLAGGEPVPTVGLSVNGVTLHSQKSLLMTTIIHNITRDVSFISCTVDNSVGEPAETTKMVTVNREPRITAPLLTSVGAGDSLKLQCTVDAYPAPKLGLFRDSNMTRGIMGTSDPRIKVLTLINFMITND